MAKIKASKRRRKSKINNTAKYRKSAGESARKQAKAWRRRIYTK
jgi:hypothetical protein